MSSVEERLAQARVGGPRSEATARARAATLVAASASGRRDGRRLARTAQVAIAAIALVTVAGAVVAIVVSRGQAPEPPRPASTTHQTSVQKVGGLRGLHEAPRAQRLPGWVAQAYRDAQGGDAPAGPALLLVTAAGPDHEAIYAWPTRSGDLTLAGPTTLGTVERRQVLPVLFSSSGDDRLTPSGIGVYPGRHRGLLYGLVADDVVAVAVRVAGTYQPAALAHDAFAYQLPHATTAGSLDAVRLTRADGTTRTVPVPGAQRDTIVLGRGQASDAGDQMSTPLAWHLPTPARTGRTALSGPRVDLVASSALVPSPVVFGDGCPVLPRAIAQTTALVLVARWPVGSGAAPDPSMTWARKLGLAPGAVPCWPGRASVIDLADQHGALAVRITVLMAPRETEVLRRQTRAVVESVGLTRR